MSERLVGQTVGKYRVERLLGTGGMGAVYLARDLSLHRPVALKVMHALFAQQPNFRARFEQEARAAARLDHPNLIKVYDLGQSGSLLYIVMEYIGGPTLHDKLVEWQNQGRQLPLPDALHFCLQIIKAIAYVHDQGVLHRDLKPANILLKPAQATTADVWLPYQPVITDLGLAKLQDGGLNTVSGAYIGGTPVYMSPEQAQGQRVDERSDVYALGLILYELAVGQRPFPINSLTDAVHYHVFRPPPPPRNLRRDLPAALEKVMLKALAKAPADRYPSATALAQAVAVGGAATLPAEQPTLPFVLGGRSRAPRSFWRGATLLAALGVGVWFFVVLLTGAPPVPPATATPVVVNALLTPTPTNLPAVAQVNGGVSANSPTATDTSTALPIPSITPVLTAMPTRTSIEPTSTLVIEPTSTMTPTATATTIWQPRQTSTPVEWVSTPTVTATVSSLGVVNLANTVTLLAPQPEELLGKDGVHFRFQWQPDQKRYLETAFPDAEVELVVIADDGNAYGMTKALAWPSVGENVVEIIVRKDQWETMKEHPWYLQPGETYAWTVRLGRDKGAQGKFEEYGRLAAPRPFRFGVDDGSQSAPSSPGGDEDPSSLGPG